MLLSVRSPPGFQLLPQLGAAVKTKFSLEASNCWEFWGNSHDSIFVFFHGSTQVETCLLKLV